MPIEHPEFLPFTDIITLEEPELSEDLERDAEFWDLAGIDAGYWQ